jgi:hypothetical protein
MLTWRNPWHWVIAVAAIAIVFLVLTHVPS